MALNENDRAAEQLLDDYLKIHRRLVRQKIIANTGKQPKRMKPQVFVWRAEEQNNGKPSNNKNRLREAVFGR